METLHRRKDQTLALALAWTVGITAGLAAGYFKPVVPGYDLASALLTICLAICGAGLGCCSIGLKNSKGLVAWMPFGFIGVMGALSIRPFDTLPVSLFGSWIASFLIICGYHVRMNRGNFSEN